MNAKSTKTLLLVQLGAALLASACQSDSTDVGSIEPSPGPTTTQTEPLRAGPARSLLSVAQTPTSNFKLENNVFVASAQTHAINVREGIAVIVPYQTLANGQRIAGEPITLETNRVARDEDDNLAGAIARTYVANDGLQIERGTVREVIANREDGVEQSWQFSREPEGSGDIVVEVTVANQELIADTATGLHFKSNRGLGFKYSHGIWTGADGHEWDIQAKYSDGTISLHVPADIVAQTVFPAVLDPTITAEIAVDSPVTGHTGTNSHASQIAFDGTNYLVVWADGRLSRDEDIFATRISPAGVVLDTSNLQIAVSAGSQKNPTVTFANGAYVVAWEDFKVSGGTEADIKAATVTPAGAVTQLGTIAGTATTEIQPALASRGADALLAWNVGSDIKAAVFSGGSFGAPFTVAGTAALEVDPAIAADPAGNYLVAWSEGAAASADARGQLVTSAGALSGAVFDISKANGAQNQIAAAFDGTNFDVVWGNNNGGVNLFGTRVSTAGVVLDTRIEATLTVGGIAISLAADNQEAPAIACPATGCIVVWGDRRNNTTNGFDVYGQLLTSAFALSGAEFIISNPVRSQQVPAVINTASGFLATWDDARDNNSTTVFASRLSAAGAPQDGTGFVLASGNNSESTPALGRAGTTFGAFWSDSRAYSNSIAMVRFASNGSILDTTAKVVTNGTFAEFSPAVTPSAGTNFQLAWVDTRGADRDIYTARVNQSGVALDAAGVVVSSATGDQLVPDIANNGTSSLVVWQDRRNGNFDIYGAIIDANGVVTTNNIAICTAAGDQTRPTVGWDSTNSQWMVVWADGRVAANVDIYGARLSSAGAVLDANGVAISAASNSQFAPDLAFASGTFFVAWEDRRVDTNGDIYGARVTGGASLTVLDAAGVALSTATGAQNSVQIASLANGYVAVWTDARSVATTGLDLYGVQINSTGVVTPSEFVVSNAVEDEKNATLLESSATTVRVAYEKVRPDLGATRVETRVIQTSSASGNSCSNNAQCSTGFCVDSRCCNTACGSDSRTDCQACAQAKTGQPDGTCAPIPAGIICRNYANSVCDLREYCDGVNGACPPDIGRNAGAVCNTTTLAVCPSAAAPGPHTCP